MNKHETNQPDRVDGDTIDSSSGHTITTGIVGEVLPERISLELRGIDFRYTRYCTNNNCAIAKAVRRQLHILHVNEDVDELHIGNDGYYHSFYSPRDFDWDKELARKQAFSPNAVIRTIQLTKI